MDRASNYPELLSEIPRYCYPLEIFNRDISQGHNKIARVGFEQRPCRSRFWRFNHSTTLPTNKIRQSGQQKETSRLQSVEKMGVAATCNDV